MTRVAVALLVAALLVTGCADQKEQYCDEVKSHQADLGKVLGDDSPDGLLGALSIFRDLQEKAPEDIRADWRTVVDALEGLQDALDDAGVDPATYDRENPPAGVTQDQQDAIDSAARALTSPATVQAFESVQQQAKDVCGTPLQS